MRREKTTLTLTLTLALGSAFAVSFAAVPVASAAGNPFGMQPLKSGYLLADAKMQDGKCGSMKAKDTKHGGSMGDKAAPAGKK